MLQITIPKTELFNEETEEFIQVKETILYLEHSLLSISKWEAYWKKPFLVEDVKTIEELVDYVRCMTINQNFDSVVYNALTKENIIDVKKYIENTMTATTFKDQNGPKGKEIITSEIIYYWMIELGIPFECQKWHLNRLLALINVCSIKNTPSKKMNKKEVLKQQSALNAARRSKFNSRG